MDFYWEYTLYSQVLATELKNNANKLAKWTAQALLSGADQVGIYTWHVLWTRWIRYELWKLGTSNIIMEDIYQSRNLLVNAILRCINISFLDANLGKLLNCIVTEVSSSKCADEVGVCFKGAFQGQLQSYYAHHPRLQAKRVCRPDQPQRQQHVGYSKGICILVTAFFQFLNHFHGNSKDPRHTIVIQGVLMDVMVSHSWSSPISLILISHVPFADCGGHMHETWWRKIPASEGPKQTYREVYMTYCWIYHFQVVVLHIWFFFISMIFDVTFLVLLVLLFISLRWNICAYELHIACLWRLYSVPTDAFENDYAEEPLPEVWVPRLVFIAICIWFSTSSSCLL